MARFFHFCSDEKFINSAYNQFQNLFPDENKFYIYGCPKRQTTHIKLNEDYEFIDNIKETFENIPDNAVVFFHSLPDSLIWHLEYFKKSVTLVWFLFGYEVYNDHNLYSEKKSLDVQTREIFGYNHINLKEQLKRILWPFLRKIKPDLYYTKWEEKILKLKRINYFGFYYPEEYKQICKLLNFERPLFNFWYYPIEDIVINNELFINNKEFIMIGNSGFKTNNHIDVFSKISKLGLKNKIVMPISYGNKNYTEQLIKHIEEHYNYLEINYLQQFLTLNEYNAFLNSIKTAIFNTRRQQAIGNIITLINNGSKVFISEKNTFYHYLVNRGIKVFSYEKDMNLKEINSSLDIETIKSNREKLYDLLNHERLKNELLNSIKKILPNE